MENSKQLLCIRKPKKRRHKFNNPFSSKSKEPFHKSKEAFVKPFHKSKEAFVKSKEPFVKSKKPFHKSKEPFVKSKEPLPKSRLRKMRKCIPLRKYLSIHHEVPYKYPNLPQFFRLMRIKYRKICRIKRVPYDLTAETYDERKPHIFHFRRFYISWWRAIHYKNIRTISRYIGYQGRIIPRRVTKLTFRKQKLMTSAIKKARMLGLLPFQENEKHYMRVFLWRLMKKRRREERKRRRREAYRKNERRTLRPKRKSKWWKKFLQNKSGATPGPQKEPSWKTLLQNEKEKWWWWKTPSQNESGATPGPQNESGETKNEPGETPRKTKPTTPHPKTRNP